MPDLFTLLAGGLVVIGIGGIVGIVARDALIGLRRKSRLMGEARPESASATAGLALHSLVGSVRRLGDRMENPDPTQLSALRQRLMLAGFVGQDAVAFYLGARTLALLAATAGTVLLLPFIMGGKGGFGVTLLAGAFGAAAVLGPDQLIRMQRTRREREYREGFPDVLDLMVASVQAGLSLDAAVNRIAEELRNRYPNLGEHMRLMTLELRAGQSRRDAWTRFAERLGIDEARAFATMLRQAEDMGSSLGETLSTFSDDMRHKRMIRAEEQAMALPAKLMIPLILFIFPCLLGVLILPAAVHIMQAFKH
ncbi:MAG TPA: type II secretion system F family protein [Caulobacteraceae bacterium]|nr:type II secretion system F family protein [Caulobacteraceae bacterium]